MVKCPYYGFEGESKLLKMWEFSSYSAKMLECPNCRRVFNYYHGISPKTKKEISFIKIKPRKGLAIYHVRGGYCESQATRPLHTLTP